MLSKDLKAVKVPARIFCAFFQALLPCDIFLIFMEKQVVLVAE